MSGSSELSWENLSAPATSWVPVVPERTRMVGYVVFGGRVSRIVCRPPMNSLEYLPPNTELQFSRRELVLFSMEYAPDVSCQSPFCRRLMTSTDASTLL